MFNILFMVVAVGFMLTGCEGCKGDVGPVGPSGVQGPQGPAGPGTSKNVLYAWDVDSSSAAAEGWQTLVSSMPCACTYTVTEDTGAWVSPGRSLQFAFSGNVDSVAWMPFSWSGTGKINVEFDLNVFGTATDASFNRLQIILGSGGQNLASFGYKPTTAKNWFLRNSGGTVDANVPGGVVNVWYHVTMSYDSATGLSSYTANGGPVGSDYDSVEGFSWLGAPVGAYLAIRSFSNGAFSVDIDNIEVWTP